jgi:hypothetical protein
MAPPHPGTFVREEILDELGLAVGEAAKVLDVRRAALSDLLNGQCSIVGVLDRESIRRKDGNFAEHAGVARLRDAATRERDRRQTGFPEWRFAMFSTTCYGKRIYDI